MRIKQRKRESMGKIVYLMGKSSSGKDTVFKELMKEGTMDLEDHRALYDTTDPGRRRERCGIFFTDEAGFQTLKASGKGHRRQSV